MLEVEGRKYFFGNVKMVERPLPLALKMQTLAGMVDYVNADKDKLNKDGLMLVAVNHKQVVLVGVNEFDTQRRPCYAASDLCDINVFPFGEFLSYEAFMIKLLCLFQKSTELEEFIRKVSKIRATDNEEHEDTGVAIQKTTKEGVFTEASREVVELKPFRTFQELDQPASKFIFRISRSRGELQCALFECDGGAWINGARQAIKEYFAKHLPTISVLA